MDPGIVTIAASMTAGTVGGMTSSAIGPLLVRLFGPWADYVGQDFVERLPPRRGVNILQICSNAEGVLGEKLLEEGTVSPKVIKEIVDEGSYCDDPLGQKYFGGVLAASRTEATRDDRGASYAALVGRLDIYQLRAHYLFYTAFKSAYNGLDKNLGLVSVRNNARVYLPYQTYLPAMLEPGESYDAVIANAFNGLARETLIENPFSYGDKGTLRSLTSQEIPGEDGLIFTPSPLDIMLYCWAHGRSDIYFQNFLKEEYAFPPNPQIAAIEGYPV